MSKQTVKSTLVTGVHIAPPTSGGDSLFADVPKLGQVMTVLDMNWAATDMNQQGPGCSNADVLVATPAFGDDAAGGRGRLGRRLRVLSELGENHRRTAVEMGEEAIL